MANHPNRGPRGPSANPAPAAIRATREAAGLTQAQAAKLVHATLRAWQNWEAPLGNSARRMHPGLWELFLRKLPEHQNAASDRP